MPGRDSRGHGDARDDADRGGAGAAEKCAALPTGHFGDQSREHGRSIELTGLAHRKHYKAQPGIDHWLKVKLETIPVSKLRYERMSIPMQKAVVSRINKVAAILHLGKPPLAKAERDLGRAEKLIQLYEPFILHNEHVFECENARLLSAALPPEEKEMFDFSPETIDWWDYWINIHIPALRRCAIR